MPLWAAAATTLSIFAGSISPVSSFAAPSVAAAYIQPITATVAAFAQRFTRLSEQWQRETEFGSVNDIMLNPAYQQIIGMGTPAIPYILRALKHAPDHWFWALYAITGQDPASESQTFESATAAWLDWGMARGLV